MRVQEVVPRCDPGGKQRGVAAVHEVVAEAQDVRRSVEMDQQRVQVVAGFAALEPSTVACFEGGETDVPSRLSAPEIVGQKACAAVSALHPTLASGLSGNV